MRFEKVSYNQYKQSNGEIDCLSEWNDIILPKRATSGSAGYDFYAPFDFLLEPFQTILIPTGIRVILDEDKFLALYPRSSLGFKYRLQLNNSVGIIDFDFAQSKREGHIMAKITNDTNIGLTLRVNKGEAFMQGVIQQYFKVEDDDTTEKRVGGVGSTNKGIN